MEQIISERSSVRSEIQTQGYKLESLMTELENLKNSSSEDNDNSSQISSVMARINEVKREISDLKQRDNELERDQREVQGELNRIEQQEQQTLADIQDSATRANQNIQLVSSFGGDYGNVASTAAGGFQQSLGQLSQAAAILGGSVASGAAGGGAGARAGRTGGAPAGASRNFYEAANDQRNASKPSALGSRGGSSRPVSDDDLQSNVDSFSFDDDKPKKKGGLGRRSSGNDFETHPETLDKVNVEKVGEFAPSINTNQDGWIKLGEEFADGGNKTTWDDLKDEPFTGNASNDSKGGLFSAVFGGTNKKDNSDKITQDDYSDIDVNKVRDKVISGNSKFEDLSRAEFEALENKDPMLASQIQTDYAVRTTPPDDLNSMRKNLELTNNHSMRVIDQNMSVNKSIVKDLSTEKTYDVYPNPLGRISHMDGKQGNNRYGFQETCGMASAAKGVNDYFGSKVTNESRVTDYAVRTNHCTINRDLYGNVKTYDSGYTNEGDVKSFYNANGIKADAYVNASVPSENVIAERLKNGDVVSLAVNHDLMWNWDDAMAFDPKNIDSERYRNDKSYKQEVKKFMAMQNGGVFRADHFVNVSNAVYDHDSGSLAGFIVSDTGNGTTKFIDKEYLVRAYNGLGNIGVSARGCVIAGGKLE